MSLFISQVNYMSYGMIFLHFVKVCERSLSGTGAGRNAAAALQFVRAEMLPSGYLVRPCEGGGSIIHIVDHINLEVISLAPELPQITCLAKI